MDGFRYGSTKTNALYSYMDSMNGSGYVPKQTDFYKKTPNDPIPGGGGDNTANITLDNANHIDNETYIWSPQNRSSIRMTPQFQQYDPSITTNKLDPLNNSSQKVPNNLLLSSGTTFRKSYINQSLS